MDKLLSLKTFKLKKDLLGILKNKFRPYNNLYSLIPAKPHTNLLESGLANKASNYMLGINIFK
jgi:hypothetical protein